jgi:hypothetical protein
MDDLEPTAEDPPGVFDYPLRAHITVADVVEPVVIGFPGWDELADWLGSPGRLAQGSVETITIVWTGGPTVIAQDATEASDA